MRVCTHIKDLRAQVNAWRRAGEGPMAFVPTMGNLHQGHLELVQQARARAARTLVSLFVNPLQFGPSEDFQRYPRTPEVDQALLREAGVDLLFAPRPGELYPHGLEVQTRVEVPGLSDLLCGASRPGHFVGVATVVCKLFNIVQPDLALFGEKDFQQLLVIRRMVADLCMPVEILGIPTVREADGLAMSSRNGYLEPDERARAPRLFAALERAAAGLREGQPVTQVERTAWTDLEAAGLRPDYVSVRRADDLAPPGVDDRDLVILVAAYLGRARLIDNLRVRW